MKVGRREDRNRQNKRRNPETWGGNGQHFGARWGRKASIGVIKSGQRSKQS